jgi:hypothetical protein
MLSRPAFDKEMVRKTEEILVYLFGKAGETTKRNTLRKKLTDEKIVEVAKKPPENPTEKREKPSGWGMDRLGNFLETAQLNTEASFVLSKNLYARLIDKDAHFSVMEDVTIQHLIKGLRDKHPNQVLSGKQIKDEEWMETYFFKQAHSCFLGATRLAMSGQVPQAYMVMRGLLENAMYCFRVHHNPTLKIVWLNRGADLKACKDNFRTFQIWEDFRNHAPSHIYTRLNGLYDKTVDDGAHPNVNAYVQNAVYVSKDNSAQFTLNILNPGEADNCLSALIDAAEVALEVFDLVFDTID